MPRMIVLQRWIWWSKNFKFMVLNFKSNELLILSQKALNSPNCWNENLDVPFSKSAKILKFLDLEQKLSMKKDKVSTRSGQILPKMNEWIWMNTTDRSSPSFGLNSYFKERNLKPLQIWKVEHQNIHFPNLKILAPLGEKRNFFGSLGSRIWNQANVLYFTLWYSPYQECSNHRSFAWIQLFYQIWQAKTKTVWLIFGCTLLNDQTCNSNHFIVVKILAWLSLVCWVKPAGHLWVFDKHNASPKFLSHASTLRWKLPLKDWGSCIWGAQGSRGLSYFLEFILSPVWYF